MTEEFIRSVSLPPLSVSQSSPFLFMLPMSPPPTSSHSKPTPKLFSILAAFISISTPPPPTCFLNLPQSCPLTACALCRRKQNRLLMSGPAATSVKRAAQLANDLEQVSEGQLRSHVSLPATNMLPACHLLHTWPPACRCQHPLILKILTCKGNFRMTKQQKTTQKTSNYLKIIIKEVEVGGRIRLYQDG